MTNFVLGTEAGAFLVFLIILAFDALGRIRDRERHKRMAEAMEQAVKEMQNMAAGQGQDVPKDGCDCPACTLARKAQAN